MSISARNTRTRSRSSAAPSILRGESGCLGAGILGSAYDFDLEIRVGAGAYVCGEETALLESLEGKRGQVRAKPPLPAHKGLFGQPTVVNNVDLAGLGAVDPRRRRRRLSRSRASAARAAPCRSSLPAMSSIGGLFEAAFGLTLGEIVDEIGGGTATGRPVRAVQVGGPLGAYFPRALFDTPFDYEAFTAKNGLIGHGGVVVFDDTVDMARQARFAMEFCAIESCGKCTPCRIGSMRGVEVIDRIISGERRSENLALLKSCARRCDSARCARWAASCPIPVMSALDPFPRRFRLAPLGRCRCGLGGLRCL